MSEDKNKPTDKKTPASPPQVPENKPTTANQPKLLPRDIMIKTVENSKAGK
ncbi:MAG: hypothetical protein NTZ12_07135 [Candidatus Aminicenantes bacterium]|nr:hypothetical protein [Candidatus Aminicenantes bacterium]